MRLIDKRNIIAILLAVAAAFQFGANAQRGEKMIGIGGGYAGYNNGGYAKLFFQYGFSNHFRLAPEVGAIFSNGGKSGIEVSLDAHFPFRISPGFKFYPLAGLTMNHWRLPSDSKLTKAGADAGVGLDFYMTSSLKINFQAKYSIMKKTDGWFIDLGVGYVF